MIFDWPYLTIFTPDGGSTIINLWLYIIRPAINGIGFAITFAIFTLMIVFREDFQGMM